MMKYLIILGTVVLGLGALCAKMISDASGSFKPYLRATILYLLVVLVFFAVLGCLGSPVIIESPVICFLLLQCCFLSLGILHIYAMSHNLAWSKGTRTFWARFVFTVLAAGFGSIGFLLLFHLVNKNGLQYFMSTSILAFIIPVVYFQTFVKAVAIPPKVLKQWFYPVSDEIEEPEDSKLKNLLVISFEFQKMLSDPHFTNFRAKAPIDMEFGKLFYFFINDYNERHPNGKIQYANGPGEPNGWIFYKKPRWYSVSTHYIDTDKTIFNNHIKENDVIICARSLN